MIQFIIHSFFISIINKWDLSTGLNVSSEGPNNLAASN